MPACPAACLFLAACRAGHALQHMLTEQREGLVAGIRGVEWDAVELPSQFMENWAYDRATL